MSDPQSKSLNTPDQVLNMERGRIDIVEIAGGGVGRATFQPGWKWSEHEKPAVGGAITARRRTSCTSLQATYMSCLQMAARWTSTLATSLSFRPATMAGLSATKQS